jgi:AcrR family transcriptional regulator
MALERTSTVSRRPRGRPRLTIDRDAVADAVAELFAEGGYEAVSIIDVAEKLSVSRATLYRTVPTKEELLGILFERSTRELTDRVKTVIAEYDDPREQLIEMIKLHADAAVKMRIYMPVFFGGGDLPPDVLKRWHTWEPPIREVVARGGLFRYPRRFTGRGRSGGFDQADPRHAHLGVAVVPTKRENHCGADRRRRDRPAWPATTTPTFQCPQAR